MTAAALPPLNQKAFGTRVASSPPQIHQNHKGWKYPKWVVFRNKNMYLFTMQQFNITFGLLWGYPVNLHPNESNSSQKHLPKAKFPSLLKPLETWQFWSSCFAMASKLRIILIMNGCLNCSSGRNLKLPGTWQLHRVFSSRTSTSIPATTWEAE